MVGGGPGENGRGLGDGFSMKADVTIIIPCYNHGHFVGEAVASARAQTVPASEIIVVDDGSDDATREACAKLASPGVRVIRHETNRGLGASRNTAIAAAKSGIILPLDADDRLRPEFIERTLPHMVSSANTGWVYTDCSMFGAREGFLDFPEYDLMFLLAHNLCLATCLFRRKDWEKVGGYDPVFRGGQEDWDFWISLAELGLRGQHVAERLLEYRQHDESMRMTSHRDIGAASGKLWAKHRRLYEGNAEGIWRHFVGRFYGGAADPFRAGSSDTAWRRVVRRLKPRGRSKP